MIKKGQKVKLVHAYQDREIPEKSVEFYFGTAKEGSFRQCQCVDITREDNKTKYNYIGLRIFGGLECAIGDEVIIEDIVGVNIYKGKTYVSVVVERFYTEGMDKTQKEVEFSPYK